MKRYIDDANQAKSSQDTLVLRCIYQLHIFLILEREFMEEKYYNFVLNLDLMYIMIVEGGKEPAQYWPLGRLCKLYGDYYAVHRWFIETIDTPYLSQDSTYKVILDNQTTVLETWQQFIDFCDLVFAEIT